MKRLLLPVLILTTWAHAHDHVEVGQSSENPSQLALDGPGYQLALFVPQGEPFSGYAPNFPGGYFASELTFTTEVDVLDSADGSDPVIELFSVTGPTGAFSPSGNLEGRFQPGANPPAGPKQNLIAHPFP